MIKPCPTEFKTRILEFMYHRFGIDTSFFDPYLFYLGPKGKVMIGPKAPLDLQHIDTASIHIALVQRTVKPSTNFIQSFGSKININRIPLSKEQTQSYCSGEDILLDKTHLKKSSDGFVALFYADIPLGCGLLRGSNLINQLPKAYRLPNLLL